MLVPMKLTTIFRGYSVAIAFVGPLIGSTAFSAELPKTIEFNRDVRPILSENCFACHGPDKNHREADLRLDIAPYADEASESQTAIVPGKPEVSEVIRRITSEDADEVMPPPSSHKNLSADQKEILRRWIEQGAEYQGHWAYESLVRPTVPSTEQTGSGKPATNPIDAFVDSKLKELEIDPAEKADRRTLIRRLSLDLCGLPPDPNRVEAFVQDKSPDAYEKLVDEYMNSEAFAEKQTIHWLDAVRYADTAGFHGDQDLALWPYRDYVLKAFHTNKPFDVFTKEQIAGDLLPKPSEEQLIATAFNRLNRMSSEGVCKIKSIEQSMLRIEYVR